MIAKARKYLKRYRFFLLLLVCNAALFFLDSKGKVCYTVPKLNGNKVPTMQMMQISRSKGNTV